MTEAHSSKYFIHPGSTKMFHHLKTIYCQDGMKKDIAEYEAKCPNYLQVKVEHLKCGGLTQIIQVLTWKWAAINMDGWSYED